MRQHAHTIHISEQSAHATQYLAHGRHVEQFYLFNFIIHPTIFTQTHTHTHPCVRSCFDFEVLLDRL